MIFRSEIDSDWKWTPLHFACNYDKSEIVALLLEEEKRLRRREEKGGRERGTPSYNLRSNYGNTPMFCAESARVAI